VGGVHRGIGGGYDGHEVTGVHMIDLGVPNPEVPNFVILIRLQGYWLGPVPILVDLEKA